MQFKDLTGQVFGRLTVLREATPRPISGSRWHCVCSCGNTKIAMTRKLKSGKAKSCGCLTNEWVASFGGAFVDKAMEKVRKHGHANGYKQTSEYMSWTAMRQRCLNPNGRHWDSYGGRGIGFHEAWSDFAVFLAYMGPKPTPKHTLDRMDENGNYEPGNVRWATKTEQGQENKRTLIPVTLDGVSYVSMSAACRALGVHQQSVYKRRRRGVPLEQAFVGLMKK